MKAQAKKWPLIFMAVLYAFGLYVFYVKYVPLIAGFQAALLPVLLFVTILAFLHPEKGTLAFIFFFPLINNLPYIFGIYENTPHAPTALVLFLFYFWGILLCTAFFHQRFAFEDRIFRVLAFFSLLILSSALITVFRFANFFPFLTDGIYELTTNAFGTSAGGAIMSTVFTALDYLTGFAVFALLVSTMKSEKQAQKAVMILSASALIACLFGLFQLLLARGFGNNLLGTKIHLINATFKDSLSFGAFISIAAPLLLGASLTFRRARRIIPLLGLALALFMLYFTGSKIAIISVSAALAVFIFLSFWRTPKEEKRRSFHIQMAAAAALFLVLTASLILSILPEKEYSPQPATLSRFKIFFQQDKESLFSFRRSRHWKSGVSMIGDFPLTGVGIGAYIIELPNYAKSFSYKGASPESAENFFLQLGAELGVAGLILAVWVFALILIRLKRLMADISPLSNQRFILIGATAGIGAFFIDGIYHTYLASFEIKYSVWLLAALVFSQAKEGNGRDQGRRLKRFFRSLGLALLLVWSGVHLWNSTHALSLESRTQKYGLKHKFGFYPVEKTSEGIYFSWTKQKAGRSTKIEGPFLRFQLQSAHPDINKHPVQVKISLLKKFFREKKLLDEITLFNHDWKTLVYHVPDEVGETVILFFEVSRTWNPKKALGTPDPRDLGVALRLIRFAASATGVSLQKNPRISWRRPSTHTYVPLVDSSR